MKIIAKEPFFVQQIDRYVDREYFKVYPGFIFSHTEKVKTDKLENENILIIRSNKFPDKVDIIIDGKNYKLTRK